MVMSVATGVDVDVMGAKTLNVGGGDYIGEWQPRKSRTKRKHNLAKCQPAGGWAGCGNECAHITGNDYVISRSRLKLRRSLIAYHSTLKKGNLILGGWGLDGKRVQNEASAEMSFGECPCHNFDFELASESQSRLFIGHFARSGKFRQPLPCMPNTPPTKRMDRQAR